MNRLARPVAALLLALACSTAGAQASTASRSGDPWVDGRLADIDTYAATYRDAFVDEVVRYSRAPRELVETLLARPGWTPADVYLACALATQVGRPCREVVERRSAAPAGDWPGVAESLGIAPGSEGFHALKRAIVASYDRWARPLVVDEELARDFPARPRQPAAHPSRPAAAQTRAPSH